MHSAALQTARGGGHARRGPSARFQVAPEHPERRNIVGALHWVHRCTKAPSWSRRFQRVPARSSTHRSLPSLSAPNGPTETHGARCVPVRIAGAERGARGAAPARATPCSNAPGYARPMARPASHAGDATPGKRGSGGWRGRRGPVGSDSAQGPGRPAWIQWIGTDSPVSSSTSTTYQEAPKPPRRSEQPGHSRHHNKCGLHLEAAAEVPFVTGRPAAGVALGSGGEGGRPRGTAGLHGQPPGSSPPRLCPCPRPHRAAEHTSGRLPTHDIDPALRAQPRSREGKTQCT